jgi:hypothetical protein
MQLKHIFVVLVIDDFIIAEEVVDFIQMKSVAVVCS